MMVYIVCDRGASETGDVIWRVFDSDEKAREYIDTECERFKDDLIVVGEVVY